MYRICVFFSPCLSWIIFGLDLDKKYMIFGQNDEESMISKTKWIPSGSGLGLFFLTKSKNQNVSDSKRIRDDMSEKADCTLKAFQTNKEEHGNICKIIGPSDAIHISQTRPIKFSVCCAH